MRPEPPHSSQPLGSPNLPLVHSKVMRNFVPERLLYQAFQVLGSAGYPLVGTLEYGDSIGQMEGLKNTAIRQWSPFIKSKKRAARRDSSRFKQGWRRLILDDDRYVIHAASESRGDVAQRPFYNLVEI